MCDDMLAEGADGLGAQLAEAGARIEPVLEEILPRNKDDFVTQSTWYHLGTGGKRIRPAICVLTCEKLGGQPSRALHFAAAVELLHNALLVHDDVQDGDTVRRDRPTVWVKYGVANAINVGDFLVGAAFKAVMMSPVDDATLVRLVRSFACTLEATCAGQALDLNYRAKEDLTTDDYFKMITLKTGRYMALGMVGGAMVAGLGDDVVERIEALGEYMGAAFQIQDDLIDLTAGKGRGGVTGNDIREGKASILYAHALAAAIPSEKAELVRIMRKPREETTEEDVARVRRLYEKLGSVEFARSQADGLVAQVFEMIERIPVQDKGFFRQLTHYMVSRAT
jgi:geranylgeranyl pyrophosphate synthase